MGFIPGENRVAFPRECQLRQSRATQPTVHAGYFSVSIDSVMDYRISNVSEGPISTPQHYAHSIAKPSAASKG